MRIAGLCEAESSFEKGEVKIDESYFEARQVRGKRGRSATEEMPVFGILKRGEKVYTQIIKHCSIKKLLPIIKEHADSDAVIYSNGRRTYDGLVNAKSDWPSSGGVHKHISYLHIKKILVQVQLQKQKLLSIFTR